MADIRLIEVAGGDAALDEVERLFRRMYDFLERSGSSYALAPEGPALWRRSIERGLGRFSELWMARDGERAIGFAHGAVRLSHPHDFFQPQRVGFVTHIYVEPEYRSAAVGERLMQKLEEWFKEKGAEAVELNVLVRNEGAQRFYKRLGYEVDFVAMRKNLG